MRKTKKILDYKTKKEKRSFLVLNILLSTGLLMVVSTLLYLLVHLGQTDRIILKCLPIIAAGLILVLFYAAGTRKKTGVANRL